MARIMTTYRNKILHVDADSFFASCERAVNPKFWDKPVCVLAKEHGIILAATRDAKKFGIKTGMPSWEAEKLLPKNQAYYVSSNFSLYAKYSERLFAILREFSPDVEEYSIDEGFVDVGGLRRMYHTSFVGIARMIQEKVMRELGLPVSIGVGPTKTLAKMASDTAKPFGIYEVPRRAIDQYLDSCALSEVPGFGDNTVALLEKAGVKKITDFLSFSEERVRSLMMKPGVYLWHELSGTPAMPLVLENVLPKSISRSRTFRETTNPEHIRMEVVNHLFLCTSKLRRKGLRAKRLFLYAKDSSFRTVSIEAKDVICHASSSRFSSLLLEPFLEKIAGMRIRAIGAVFSECQKDTSTQLSFFVEDAVTQIQETLFHAVDKVNDKFGRYTVRPGVLAGKRFAQRVVGVSNLQMVGLGLAV